MGLFDGHGPHGHLISGFTMGTMLDFVKNSKQFKNMNFHDPHNRDTSKPDADIRKAIRCCFKFT